MALAAPVEVGIMDIEAARARRRSLCGQVEDALVVGEGVHSGHEALLDAEGVEQHLGHRRQTVGGTRSVGEDVVTSRVVIGVVDPHDHGDVRVFGRRADDDLPRALVEMLRGLRPLGETAGAFHHHVHPQFAPGQQPHIGSG